MPDSDLDNQGKPSEEVEPGIDRHHPLVAYARAHPDHLLITPHIGGNTRESFEKTEMFLAGKVRKAWEELSGNR